MTDTHTMASTVPTLVLGEALIDAVLALDGGVVEHVGGSPANVAFGLGALGHQVSFATWFGADARGQRIADACSAAGVTLVEGSQAAVRTSVAQATLDDKGAATYDFDITWELPALDQSVAYGHAHTGSIAATLEPGGTAVLETLRALRETATISYDPNMRPTLMGSPDAVRSRVENIISVSDVVKASDEDVAWLYPGESVSSVLSRWRDLGAQLTVLTMGGAGAMYGVLASTEFTTLLPGELKVVDTVGAGDSFMAGLISGLLDAGLLGGPEARQRLRDATHDTVDGALSRAMSTAAVTVTRAGAYAPRRSELDA